MGKFFENYRKPAWLPDWKNPAEYIDHGDDLEAWAWEFIRRNPEYQTDYARWACLPDDDGEGGNSLKYGGASGAWVAMPFFYADPPALPGETLGEYESRTGQWPTSLHDHLTQRWHLIQISDPAISTCPGFFAYGDDMLMPPYGLELPDPIWDCGARFGSSAVTEHLSGRLYYASWPEEIDSNVHVVGFDLRFSISDQLAMIEKTLLELKQQFDGAIPRSIGAQVGNLPILLRLFDARASGAEIEEIMMELYDGKLGAGPDDWEDHKNNGRDWVRKTTPGAIRMVESGFQKLIKQAQLPTGRRSPSGKIETPRHTNGPGQKARRKKLQ